MKIKDPFKWSVFNQFEFFLHLLQSAPKPLARRAAEKIQTRPSSEKINRKENRQPNLTLMEAKKKGRERRQQSANSDSNEILIEDVYKNVSRKMMEIRYGD